MKLLTKKTGQIWSMHQLISKVACPNHPRHLIHAASNISRRVGDERMAAMNIKR